MDNLDKMNKFLKTHNHPGLKNEIENINRPLTSEEIESVIRNLPSKKVQEQMGSLVNSSKHLKNNKEQSFSNFPIKLKRRE